MADSKTVQQEVDERTNLTSSNQFELLLFRLDVETILRQMSPLEDDDIDPESPGEKIVLRQGTVIMAADDSTVRAN